MIQSLLRAMELLELLKEANHKYSIAELSESTGLPPSTIHRILQTFCEKKYVIRDEHAHTYQLGPALISLGRAAADNVRIQDAALPILKNLSYCTREDSYLIIQVGDKGLVLDKTDGPTSRSSKNLAMRWICTAVRSARRFWLSRATNTSAAIWTHA